MTTMASQITSLTVVYSTVYSDADQRKHQSSASLAFVWGIHRDRWIPRTRASYAENVSIWWRHHGVASDQSDASESFLQCWPFVRGTTGHRVIMWSFDVFIVVILNKLLGKRLKMVFTDIGLCCKTIAICLCFNASRPRQNGLHFADGIFRLIFLNEDGCISIKIFTEDNGLLNNKSRYWFRMTIFYLKWWLPRLLTYISATMFRWVNALRPGENGQHFADDNLKRIFFNENIWISIKIALKYVPTSPINNIPALFQIMAWRRPGDKLAIIGNNTN